MTSSDRFSLLTSQREQKFKHLSYRMAATHPNALIDENLPCQIGLRHDKQIEVKVQGGALQNLHNI